jgi:hypothetical protein
MVICPICDQQYEGKLGEPHPGCSPPLYAPENLPASIRVNPDFAHIYKKDE